MLRADIDPDCKYCLACEEEYRAEIAHCADCGHAWDALLDIGACFWAELASHARQLMDSVHRLASAYGWCEADILALSPARRSAYLAMVDRGLT